MADITQTIPFNFDEINNNITQLFKDKGYDTEVGSNTAQLITAMSYLTSMLNINTAANINEMLLPSTTKRKNAVFNARTLGYEISHKQSYRYYITLQHTSTNLSIPKYSEFNYGDKSYYYMGTDIILNDVEIGGFTTILVVEGTLHRFKDNDDLNITTTYIDDGQGNVVPQYYIDIPFIDVEENGIELFATYYDDYGNLYSNELWKRTQKFLIDKDSTIYKEYIRMDDIEFRTPRLYFTLANVGEAPKLGTIFSLNVITTSGVDGGIGDLTAVSGMTNPIPNTIVYSIELSTQGADEENLDSIKTNAPLFHNTGNRAVTKNDYITICNNHAAVGDSYVWGGDEEFPKSPGHVWFSFIPSEFSRTYTYDYDAQTYTLDLNDDFNWDYSLSFEPNTGDEEQDKLIKEAYDQQVEIVNDYQANWFVEDDEIRSYNLTTENQVISPGVFDILDGYKIPTLEFHNRHPIYVDFEYEIQLYKINITTSLTDIHEIVFNIINDAFIGEDIIKIEQFSSEYLDKNILKRINSSLTDSSTSEINLNTYISINEKNISCELGANSTTFFKQYRDCFINLDIPFEIYMNNGFLDYSKLPNIDTEDFISYNGEKGYNLYTDWSDIQKQIDNGEKQINSSLIVAPIRIHQEEEYILQFDNEYAILLNSVEFKPDYPASDSYDKTKVYLNGVELLINNQWTINDEKSIILIFDPDILKEGDIIKVTTERFCGNYQLFNSAVKQIIVQLYIDANGYADDEYEFFEDDTPKSYLTTLEGFYDFTQDDYYLTTEGYAIYSEDQKNKSTGAIVRQMSYDAYEQSPIKMDLFKKTRLLNLKYPSNNFKFNKNLIPRLKKITYLKGV